jgi:hypothetical protein
LYLIVRLCGSGRIILGNDIVSAALDAGQSGLPASTPIARRSNLLFRRRLGRRFDGIFLRLRVREIQLGIRVVSGSAGPEQTSKSNDHHETKQRFHAAEQSNFRAKGPGHARAANASLGPVKGVRAPDKVVRGQLCPT